VKRGYNPIMNESPFQPAPRRSHDKGLLLIAAYKFLQAALFAAIGIGAHQVLHKNATDLIAQLAEHLHHTPETRFINFLLKFAPLVNDQMLHRIGVVVFIYAGLGLLEGTGLYLEKVWGEYLTLLLTASFLPLEIYEVVHRVTAIRVSLLVANALVFLYLVKLIVERQRKRREGQAVKEG
jgi:uncharacterized membrane protein (DUF2068 family)